MNKIQSTFLSFLPPKRKTSFKGWTNICCPACINNGQPRPDKRFRGGIMLSIEGGISYNCFNCKFKASWNPNIGLSQKMRNLLSYLGLTSDKINEFNLEIMKFREETGFVDSGGESEQKEIKLITLPNGSIPITNPKDGNTHYNRARDYLLERHEDIMSWYNNWYWTPEMPERVIIPIKYSGQLAGWVARLTRTQKNKQEEKYIASTTDKLIFGTEKFYDENRKFVVLVEGIFDAIAIDGIAIMGTDINDIQLNIIKNSGKHIVVLADRDAAGLNLIKTAIKNKWSVTFPPFYNEKSRDTVKDAFDAVKIFGRAAAVKLIIDYIESNPIKIEILSKEWCETK